MRVLTIIGVVAACGVGVLDAQRAHQFEFGAFGSFTRYDGSFNLDNRIGGGARLGYFITDLVSIEGDVGYQHPNAKTGAASAQMYHGSASLVLNFAVGDRSLVYVLGGYSRGDFEPSAPYRFTDNSVHGAIGERFFVTDRIALRLEARGIYTPQTNASFGAEWAGHVVGSLGVSVFAAGGRAQARERGVSAPPPPEPAEAGEPAEVAGEPADSDRDGVPDSRDACPGTPDGTNVNSRGCAAERSRVRYQSSAQGRRDWTYQWYWGAQGGAFFYKTNLQPLYYDPMGGGHWLITAKRTALYVAYEQAHFITDARAVVEDRNSATNERDVSFKDMRRIMLGVLAFPAQKPIEPYAGLGFALMQVMNPTVDCSGGSLNSLDCATDLAKQILAQDAAENASSKAFFWFMGGIQISYSKLSLFGQYIATSAPQGFLIAGNTHTFQGGLRYAFGTSKEGITERQ